MSRNDFIADLMTVSSGTLNSIFMLGGSYQVIEKTTQKLIDVAKKYDDVFFTDNFFDNLNRMVGFNEYTEIPLSGYEASLKLVSGTIETDEEVVECYQAMIDDGIVWNLEGFYGRTANAMIEDGVCHA